MVSKTLAAFFLVLFIQDISCISRSEVQGIYGPTFLRLKTLSNTKYQEATREYNTLSSQINQQTARSRNITQTQINNIRTIIATAKKSPNASSVALACIRTQELAANRLSTTPLNYCNVASNFTRLNTIKGRYTTIANLAGNVLAYCGYLNPLDTQLDSFAKCLADKVPDLNRQINLVGVEYSQQSNATLHFDIQCLTEKAGDILGQVGVISYETNGIPCLSLKDITSEYQPAIDELRARVSTLYKSGVERTSSTKALILNNISDARNLTSRQLISARNVLNQARIQTARSNQAVKNCVTAQHLELAKIPPGNYLNCSGDFRDLTRVRGDIVTLEKTVLGLVSSCFHLNPLNREEDKLRLCLNQKIQDIKLQLNLVEKEFEDVLKHLVNGSVECIVEQSGQIYAKIGAVLGALKNCKINH